MYDILLFVDIRKYIYQQRKIEEKMGKKDN